MCEVVTGRMVMGIMWISTRTCVDKREGVARYRKTLTSEERCETMWESM